jgi:hypothetical protein
MRLFAVLAACAAVSVPVMVQAENAPATTDAAQPADAKPVKPAKPKSDKICKAIPSVESRLGTTHECHTKAEWDALARESREQLTHRGSVSGPH